MIDIELVKKLDEWVSEGKRDVDISMSTLNGTDCEYKIWAYDYEINHVKSVKTIKDIPTREGLKKEREAMLMKELNNL